MKLLHNHSLCKHVQTQAEVLFLENVLDLSQPTSASKPAASFIVFGGCSHILLISTCFVFFVFSASDTHWVRTGMTGMMCHHRLGHCWT